MKKIILDCDPGMDDSIAIAMAVNSQKINLLGVTTVSGNYPVDLTCTNALKMLELLDRSDIPVAKGMSTSILRQTPSDPFSHGEDGQGENFLPPPSIKADNRNAVNLIVDLVKQHPHEITIVLTGPMSNLAMALLLYPEIEALIAGVVAISGMFGLNRYAFENATGDTPQSEWNVYVDPDAAKIVYNSSFPLTVLGLDVATLFNIDFSDKDIEALKNSSRKEAGFLYNAISFVKSRGYKAYCTVIDALAIAYLIMPDIIQTFPGRVGVETREGLTQGMTVLDRRHHHIWEHLPIINIAKSADYTRFLNLLMTLILKEESQNV